jgi:hypothetical protein
MKVTAKDFEIIDLTDETEIEKFLREIQINNDEEIVIDVSGCLIMYDTAEFIDKLLGKIRITGKQKKLTIQIDYNFISEDSLYDWLFRKSSVLEHDVSTDNVQNIKSVVLQKIKNNYNIEFTVEILNG